MTPALPYSTPSKHGVQAPANPAACIANPLAEASSHGVGFPDSPILLYRIVGTYHSRPVMPARPSPQEVQQQLREQVAHRRGEAEPYLSAICCPFDPNAPDANSTLNFIHISHSALASPADLTSASCTAHTLEVGSPD